MRNLKETLIGSIYTVIISDYFTHMESIRATKNMWNYNFLTEHHDNCFHKILRSTAFFTVFFLEDPCSAKLQTFS